MTHMNKHNDDGQQLAARLEAQSDSGQEGVNNPATTNVKPLALSGDVYFEDDIIGYSDDAEIIMAEDGPDEVTDEPADEPLTEHDEEISVADEVDPQDKDALWAAVAKNLNRSRIGKYIAGMLMAKRKDAVNRGDYVAEMKQFAKLHGMSVATLYRHVNHYNAVHAGAADLLLAAISQGAINRWPDIEDADAFDDLVLSEDEADASVSQMKALLADAELQLAASKKRMGDEAPAANIRVEGLNEQERKHTRVCEKQIVHGMGSRAEFGRWLYPVIAEKAAEYPAIVPEKKPRKPKASAKKPVVPAKATNRKAKKTA